MSDEYERKERASLKERAVEIAANKAFVESLPDEKVRFLRDLQIHLKHCVFTLCDCNDLWLSDIRELEGHMHKLETLLKTEPSEYQLEKFAEHNISWPPKQRGRPKKAA